MTENRYYESMNVQSGDFVSISLVELVWEDEDVVGYLKEHF